MLNIKFTNRLILKINLILEKKVFEIAIIDSLQQSGL